MHAPVPDPPEHHRRWRPYDLRALQQLIPLEIHEVPSGRKAFDWEVPLKWNPHDAYIEDARGRRVVHAANSNLHVMSYSVPTDIMCSRAEPDMSGSRPALASPRSAATMSSASWS